MTLSPHKKRYRLLKHQNAILSKEAKGRGSLRYRKHKKHHYMTIKKFTITRVKDGSFEGTDGAKVAYFWIKGETEDGLTIEFGTKDGDREVGDTIEDLQLEKTEGARGFRYKEIQ